MDETPFSVLYADEPSRPNIPINVLVGLEAIKAGLGWSDEQLYDAFQFNLQVRYAVGYRDVGEGHFELRTLYNFRQRVSNHMQETGESLMEQAFEQVTDEQWDALGLRTDKQRMDSSQIASNIRQMSRLQLLVEVLQRVHRMLEEQDQQAEAEVFAPYLQGSAGQYCYRVKDTEVEAHLERIGRLMQRLVVELKDDYGEEQGYQLLCRVFSEHFVLEEESEPPDEGGGGPRLRVKQGEELSAQSLQSPDDWEATFRRKGGAAYRGYVFNLTETCAPDNAVQLITKVQVAPNCTDDGQLLEEALPDLKERTGLEEMWNDGGYVGPDVDEALREHEVEQVVTGIRGSRPAAGKVGLEGFVWEVDEEGEPLAVTCPQGQRVEVQSGRAAGRYLVYFDAGKCATCPLVGRCRTKPLKRRPARVLRVTKRAIVIAQKRRTSAWARAPGNNLRAAVEATGRSCKHPFGGKVPVRGQIRVSMYCVASAMMVSVRRIWRYEVARRKEERRERAKGELFLLRLFQPLAQWLRRFWSHDTVSRKVQPAYG